jgi:hypothetical protein
MNLQLTEVGNRTHLKNSGEDLRIIPKKYQVLNAADIYSALDLKDHHLYLSDAERYELEFFVILQDLKISQPWLYDLINDARPTELYYVQPVNSDPYYEMLLNNGYRIKSSAAMGKLYPENIKTIYRNF